MADTYRIRGETLTELANLTRALSGETGDKSPNEMSATLQNAYNFMMQSYQALADKGVDPTGVSPSMANLPGLIAGLGGEGLILGTSRAVTGEFTPSETVQGGSVTITTGLSDVAEKLKLDTEKAHYGNFFFMWDASRREQVSSVSPNYSSSVGGSIIGCVFLNIHTGSYLRQYALTLYYWNSNINTISNSGHCTVTNVGDSGILDTINFAYSSSKYAAGHRYCWVAGFSEDV